MQVLIKNKRKIGLSLRGGAFKGASHLGFLQALKERDIKPSFILGSSIGAFAALSYSHNVDLYQSLEHIKKFNFSRFMNLNNLRKGYFTNHKQIIEWGKSLFKKEFNFEDLNTKIGIQATNISQLRSEIFTKGSFLKPLIASNAYPFLIPPVKINKYFFVDGELSSSYSANFLRENGCDFVIGLNPSSAKSLKSGNYIAKFNTSFALSRRLYLEENLKREPLDLLIEDLGGSINERDRKNCHLAFNNGYKIGLSLDV